MEDVPEVAVWSPLVAHALGLNPGPMTLSGTNTYLVGSGKHRILIDTGEGKDGYPAVLRRAMKESNCEGIQEVVITHWHHDHVGGIEQVKAMFGNNIKISKHKSEHDNNNSNNYNYIEDGHIFKTEGATLRAITTPGHTDDHLCFYLQEENAIFGGDCVLGHGTAVFTDLHDYMSSLRKILTTTPARMYSAHGPVIHDPVGKVTDYINHRDKREQQILQALQQQQHQATAMQLVQVVYHDTPTHLHVAAENNLLQHLKKLQKDGKAKKLDNDKWIAAAKM